MSTVTLPAASSTRQNITLPDIPELFDENFLDVLIPKATKGLDEDVVPDTTSDSPAGVATPGPANPMMEALKSTANQTRTENLAPALRSTLSATLDAFNAIGPYLDGNSITKHLDQAWKEDSELTLRIIWCLRSIPDGKGNKGAFYRAFGWLFANHPRTAIANLPLLIEPVSVKRKTNTGVAHGYWKDLLNIVALAATDELAPEAASPTFFNSNRQRFVYGKNKNKKAKTGDAAERIAAHLAVNAKRSEEAEAKRVGKFVDAHQRLVSKLESDPKFRALYIAVARLFAGQLEKDLAVLDEISRLPKGKSPIPLVKTLSLAGKWAPTPGLAHDKVTNLSSAIILLLAQSQVSRNFPKALDEPLDPREKLVILRSFFQRWILRPLREAIQCPEPLMASNRWDKIKYNRVPSVCMKNNNELFFQHDPKRFENYLVDVEKGKKSISGATLMPHEIVSAIVASSLHNQRDPENAKFPALLELRKKAAENLTRVGEAQWKALVEHLKAEGTLDNCLAVCDVSGSMGSIYSKCKKNDPQPIFPSVALSLILASVTRPPFNGGFITFSHNPEFVQLDLENKSLKDTIQEMVGSAWAMNTDFNAVFLKLLLPLAKKNNLKQEDMIKRLFVFSDMQFDEARTQGDSVSDWETNYDVVEREYREAGYEVPQIVFWDLSRTTGRTVEVLGDRKGVAMLNGFSPALLKVFMGEKEEGEEDGEWQKVDKKGEEVEPEDAFTPINVMKKALLVKSFEGLVVVD